MPSCQVPSPTLVTSLPVFPKKFFSMMLKPPSSVMYHGVSDDNKTQVMIVPKNSISREEKVKVFVLSDKFSDLQIAEYCIGGRFQEVLAVNRLIRKLKGLPTSICITHATKDFSPQVFSKSFQHCNINVEIGDSKRIPLLATVLRKSITRTDTISSTIAECEIKHNKDEINSSDTPRALWDNRAKYLRSVPEELYEHQEHYSVIPQFNYHIAVKKHYYSIPWQIVEEYRKEKKQLSVIVSTHHVEIYDENNLIICVHNNDEDLSFPYTTDCTHMPDPRDVPYNNYNACRFFYWASHIGTNVVKLCKYYMRFGACEMQGYLPCLRMLGLTKKYHNVLDQACADELSYAQELKLIPSPARIRERCKTLSESDADPSIYKAPIIWKNSPGIFEEYFGDDFNAD